MADYIDIGDVRMWFDERGGGDGPPVVLLHGGLADASSFDAQVGPLSEGRRVLLPEHRGHGHTADPGEISYELMAADTAAFVEAVVGGPADLVGWSDGGIVALHVARQHPGLVRKAVTIGSGFHYHGTMPEFFEAIDHGDDGTLRAAYAAVTPDGGEHWPVFKEKVTTMWRTSPTLTVDDLADIEAPVLVMVGDDDAIRFEHTIALYESLPHGQLAVPGTSHVVPVEKPGLVNRLILDFLDDGSILSFLPLRRRE